MMKHSIFSFIFVFCLFHLLGCEAAPRPLVMWHGMGDSCCFSWSMGYIKEQIEKVIPGIYVYSVRIGSTTEIDQIDGFIGDVNQQIESVCKTVASDPKLKNGFNAIGFSQGGQFLRGLIERCPEAKVYNLVTMGGQHQGVASLPGCLDVGGVVCELVQDMLALGAYNEYVQRWLVQAQYFKDPLEYNTYLAYSKFLADINNEQKEKKSSYKENLTKLNKFVMVKWLNDTVVVPRESEWFGFFETGSDSKIVSMKDSAIYKEDWIGLKELDQRGAIQFLSVLGEHMHIDMDWFNKNVVMPYLNN